MACETELEGLELLSGLPRTVFLLHHLDGPDGAAIGTRLGVEIEAVEEKLAHTMRALIWGDGSKDDPSGI